MRIKVLYKDKVNNIVSEICEVSPHKTVHIKGLRMEVPLKELRMWMELMGCELMDIELIKEEMSNA